jgi:hypothetical protein
MGTKKIKERKKKKRAEVAKTRVLKQREELRQERKATRLQERMEREADLIVHGRPKPIINDPYRVAESEAARAKKVKQQLDHNLAILEALEREYDQEQARRSELNSQLEEEGHCTIREKMDALHQKALEITGKAEELAIATEEYAKEQAENQKIEDCN